MSEIHVCRGVRRRYDALYKGPRERRWSIIGSARDIRRAAKMAANKLASCGRGFRAVVTYSADYYEPTVSMELRNP